MSLKTKAILSHVMVILNLLFPVVYLFLLISWFKNKNSDNEMLRISINEAFVLSTLTFIVFNSFTALVLFHFGFKSTFTLIAGEVYYMLIIPLSFYPAILGIIRNNSDKIYYYPIIGKFFRQT